MTTAALARRYGVELRPRAPRGPGAPRAVCSTGIGDEDLYRIPGAALATLDAHRRNDGLPGPTPAGTPSPSRHPDPARWKLVTHSHAGRRSCASD